MKTVSTFLFALLIVSAVQAQQPAGGQGGQPAGGAGAGPGNAPAGGPTTGRGTQPTNIPDFGQPGRGTQQQQQQRNPMEQRPVFLQGKVMLDDGTPPPEPATIEIVCNGQPKPQAYTDSKGHFSFQVGQANNVMMDASVSNTGMGGFGRDNMSPGMGTFPGGGSSYGSSEMGMGCELRATLAGFRSDPVMLGRRSMFDNPDVGTIILHRLANVQGTAISFTTLAAPKDAKKSFEKAQKTLQQKNPKNADAAKDLEKAVEIYPQFAAAWNLLGEARLAMKDEDGARKAFEQSLAADTKYVNPYMRLAMLDLRAQRWASAADVTGRVTQLNPYLGQAHYFNAIANYNLGKMDLAEKSAREAVKSDSSSRFPMMHQLLGAILARQGDFPSAAEEFRSYLKMSPDSQQADQIRKQLTEWEGLGVIQRAEAAAKK
jgi:Flp pilus assembly protein TadD